MIASTRLRWGGLLATALPLLVGLPLACSKNETAPPPNEDDTGTLDTGTTSDGGRDTGTTDGPPGDSALPDGDASGDADAPVTAACAKSYTDNPGTAVTYPGRATTNERLAAMTWDELTMAWITNVGGKITVHYSDRADKDAAFTTDNVLPDSLGLGDDKVALSADGLTMIVGSADHKSLRQIKRSARGSTFDATSPDGAPFARLVGAGGEGGPAKQVSDVVLSKDGKWLFYTDPTRTAGASMMVSVRLADGTFDDPNPLPEDRLLVVGGKYRRRPTGISADGLTLFYFDEAIGASFLAFHPPGSLGFDGFYAFAPSGSGATPSESCSRVYLTMEIAPAKPDAGPTGDAIPDATPGSKSVPAIFHAP